MRCTPCGGTGQIEGSMCRSCVGTGVAEPSKKTRKKRDGGGCGCGCLGYLVAGFLALAALYQFTTLPEQREEHLRSVEEALPGP